MRGASAEAEFLRQERPEAEGEHNAFHGKVAFDKAALMVPDVFEVVLVHVGDLVQEDFAGKDGRGQSDLGGQPVTVFFVFHAPEREEADFRGCFAAHNGQPAKANPLAQGETDRNCGHPEGTGHFIGGVLQFVTGGEAGGTKLGVALQGTDHGRDAFGGGTEVAHHPGKRGVGREVVGTETRGNVAHISRRARARVSRVRAYTREGGG